MNPLDILFVVILIYCTVMGLFRGTVRELSAIGGVFIGLVAAFFLHVPFSGTLSGWISDDPYRRILGFLVVFLFTIVLVAVVSLVVRYLLKVRVKGWLDRLSGGGLGVVKALMVGAILLLVLVVYLPTGAPIVLNSVLAPRMVAIAGPMSRIAPKDMEEKFRVNVAPLKRRWTGR